MKVVIILTLVFVSGCATQGTNTMQYSEGKTNKVENETTVSAPYSQVWDTLVRDLAKSFYVINNIDKESRIINISFNSTDPVEFVDCGRSTRTYTEGGVTERYEYDVAAKTSFKVATSRQEHPSFSNYVLLTREPNLEGRSNIYVAPLVSDPTKTTVSVNTRYILSVKVKGEGFAKHVSGNIQTRGRIPEDSTTFTFNTNSVAKHDAGSGVTVTCSSKGKLESDILDIIKAK